MIKTRTEMFVIKDRALWIIRHEIDGEFKYGVKLVAGSLREFGDWPFSDIIEYPALISIEDWMAPLGEDE